MEEAPASPKLLSCSRCCAGQGFEVSKAQLKPVFPQIWREGPVASTASHEVPWSYSSLYSREEKRLLLLSLCVAAIDVGRMCLRDLCIIIWQWTCILPAKRAQLTVEGSPYDLVKDIKKQQYVSVQRCVDKHRFEFRMQGIPMDTHPVQSPLKGIEAHAICLRACIHIHICTYMYYSQHEGCALD